MEYILLAVATLSYTAKALAWKKIGSENQKGARLHLINTIIFLISALTVFLVGLITHSITTPCGNTILLGLLYSLFSTMTQILLIRAMGMGEASLTQLVYSLGILLPIGYGALFLHEEISPLQIVGMLVVGIALYLIISPKKGTPRKPMWLLFSLLSAGGSGAIAIVQKIHQNSDAKAELQMFVILSLLFSTIFSLFLFLVTFKRSNVEGTKPNGKFWIFLVLCGICIGVLNLASSACTGLLPAVVQFPVYNIGSMVLVGIFSYVLFRERLTRMKLIGFFLGCIAILLIGLF